MNSLSPDYAQTGTLPNGTPIYSRKPPTPQRQGGNVTPEANAAPVDSRARQNAATGRVARSGDPPLAASEKQLQNLIRNFLNLRDWYFDQDAMHKRRFGTVGAPDFQFPYRGRFVAWECKVQGGKLTTEQEQIREAILKQGGEWRLIQKFDDAQEHLRAIDLAIALGAIVRRGPR